MELSSPKLKELISFLEKRNFLIFQEGTCKARKTKTSYISLKKLFHGISHVVSG